MYSTHRVKLSSLAEIEVEPRMQLKLAFPDEIESLGEGP